MTETSLPTSRMSNTSRTFVSMICNETCECKEEEQFVGSNRNKATRLVTLRE